MFERFRYFSIFQGSHFFRRSSSWILGFPAILKASNRSVLSTDGATNAKDVKTAYIRNNEASTGTAVNEDGHKSQHSLRQNKSKLILFVVSWLLTFIVHHWCMGEHPNPWCSSKILKDKTCRKLIRISKGFRGLHGNSVSMSRSVPVAEKKQVLLVLLFWSFQRSHSCDCQGLVQNGAWSTFAVLPVGCRPTCFRSKSGRHIF